MQLIQRWKSLQVRLTVFTAIILMLDDWVFALYIDHILPIASSTHSQIMLVTGLLTIMSTGMLWWLISANLAPLRDAAKKLAHTNKTLLPLVPLPIVKMDEVGQLIQGINDLIQTVGDREVILLEQDRLLVESQRIAGLGSYELDIESNIWIGSETLNNLCGIDNVAHPFKLWENIIHPDDRDIMITYFAEAVIGKREPFDKIFCIIRQSDKEVRWVHGLGRLELNADQKLSRMIGTIQDITDRHNVEVTLGRTEEKIIKLAFYDYLTQIPNRRLFIDKLEPVRAACLRNGHYGAIAFLDLDNFKTINDTAGHNIGDVLLQQVARRIVDCTRPSDTVARLGGDEFVILITDLDGVKSHAAQQAEIVCEKIRIALAGPYMIDGIDYISTPSIGITLFNDNIIPVTDLLKRADLAMYQAKSSGKNTIRFFDPDMQLAVETRNELLTDFKHGIEQKQFVLYYQPQINSQGKMTGCEALVRWQHPTRGTIPPLSFIPLAEETGLIIPLGQWIFQSACEQQAAWRYISELKDLTIAVNMSIKQFNHPEFIDCVQNILTSTGADPTKIELEITESFLVSDVDDLVDKMSILRNLGIEFSVDDFGTGYSSLAYLRHLPLSKLKIDASFVRDILTQPEDLTILKIIVSLGTSLGLSVVAEGVETEQQCAVLANNGCNIYQGYLFSRPLPANELAHYAKNNLTK